MKKPFTLIELMVVVGIAGLLMTIAIPSYNKILKSSGTDNAAAALKLAVEQAQAKAVSSRRDVALIIPNSTKEKFYGKVSGQEDDTPAFNKDTYTRYYAGSARMAYVKKDSQGKWNFVKWVPGSKWLEPFKDSKIVMVSDRYGDLPEKEGDALEKCTAKVVDEVYRGSNSDDGFVKVSGIPGNPSDRCAMIFSPFGGLHSKRDLFVAVAECTLSGDKIAYPNESDPVNYIVLDVNRLSGKVSYHAYEREEGGDDE